MATTQYPKREERKKASRAALVDAAIKLFAANGFEETKLEAVADEAGLHVQTLYRHFANKRELITAVDEHYLERFERACAARKTDTLTFWRSWVERSTSRIAAHSVNFKKAVTDLYGLPDFPTPYLRIWHQYERTLALGLAEDMGLDAEAPMPVLIACMVWGGTSHVLRRWLESGGDCDLVADALAIIDTVIAEYGDRVRGRQQTRC